MPFDPTVLWMMLNGLKSAQGAQAQTAAPAAPPAPAAPAGGGLAGLARASGRGIEAGQGSGTVSRTGTGKARKLDKTGKFYWDEVKRQWLPITQQSMSGRQ